MLHSIVLIGSAVVIDNFDVLGAVLRPNEANAPLFVDANAVLAFAVTRTA